MTTATESQRLIGGFEVLERIGEGGMGQVFLARQQRPAREVALKLIHPHLATERVRARFTREADALGRLNHPNIVAVHAFGEEDDQLYMAMERVEGVSLRGLLDAKGALEPGRAAELGRQIANALAHAHSRNVIHRDLKPSNILVTVVDGVEAVKLVDFGLARFVDSGARVTQTGRLVGSAPYMSPEQWDERPDLGGAVDIYAFGIVMYEMLTDRLPFSATTSAGYMRAHLTHEPCDPTPLQPALEGFPGLVSLVRRCIARAGRDRPSAAQLQTELGGSEPRIALSDLPVTQGWSDRDVETDDTEPPWLSAAASHLEPTTGPSLEAEATGPRAAVWRPRVVAALAALVSAVVVAAWLWPGADTPAAPGVALDGVAARGLSPPQVGPRAATAPTGAKEIAVRALRAAPTDAAAQREAPSDAALGVDGPHESAPGPSTRVVAAGAPSAVALGSPVKVEVIAQPLPASLFVGGVRVGVTPQRVTLGPTETASVVLQRRGYSTLRASVTYDAARAAEGGRLVYEMQRVPVSRRSGPSTTHPTKATARAQKKKKKKKKSSKKTSPGNGLNIERLPIR